MNHHLQDLIFEGTYKISHFSQQISKVSIMFQLVTWKSRPLMNSCVISTEILKKHSSFSLIKLNQLFNEELGWGVITIRTNLLEDTLQIIQLVHLNYKCNKTKSKVVVEKEEKHIRTWQYLGPSWPFSLHQVLLSLLLAHSICLEPLCSPHRCPDQTHHWVIHPSDMVSLISALLSHQIHKLK